MTMAGVAVSCVRTTTKLGITCNLEPDPPSYRSDHCRSVDLVDDHRLCAEPVKRFDFSRPGRGRFGQCAGAHDHRRAYKRTVYTAAGEMGRSAGGENHGESGAGPLPVDYPPDAPPSGTERGAVSDTSSPLAATSNSGTPTVANGADGLSPPLAANDGAALERTDAVAPMKPVGTTKAEADGLSASAPLSEPIRLPRPRPHDGGTVRKADTTRSRLPMPRPRPMGGGSGAQHNNPTVPLQQQ